MRKIILLIVVLQSFGCTTGRIAGGKDDDWYIEEASFLFFRSSYLYYCKAGSKSTGALPQCYEAEYYSAKEWMQNEYDRVEAAKQHQNPTAPGAK